MVRNEVDSQVSRVKDGKGKQYVRVRKKKVLGQQREIGRTRRKW